MIVFALRHADREPGDALKQPEGIERAQLLARMLAESGIRTAYCSNTIRARDTLQPLKKKLGTKLAIEVPLGGAAGTPEQQIVAAVKLLAADAIAAIVGHSDTVGPMIESLTGQTIGKIKDDQFDKLFVLSITAPGTGTVAMLRYGAPTPPPPP